MTTLAGMAFGETPERVLKRVQQLEDVELPSLPSFSHDMDYDTASEVDRTEDERSVDDVADQSEADFATPHPLRQAHLPSTSQTMSDQSGSTSGSPFPPLEHSGVQSPSSHGPLSAVTSTPIAGSRSRSMGKSTRMDITRSGTRELGNSTRVSSTKWQTPGEMSRSFSGEEILQDDVDLGSERSVPLNDASARLNRSSTGFTGLSDSPVVKRLTVSHVNLDRPKRRSTSGPSHLQALQDVADELQDTSAEAVTIPTEFPSQPPPPITDRIPSLTRSEVSHPDTSGGATTPEGPSRRVAIATPRPHGIDEQDDYEVTDDEELREQVEEEHTDNMTYDYQAQQTEQIEDQNGSDVELEEHQSPGRNVAFADFSTPGIPRNAISQMGTPKSFGQTALSNITASRDMTATHSTGPSYPFTPTPMGQHSKYENLTTPRAPLDDAERRKSHVLAVLSSTGIPARTPRAIGKGTPHPLRRVSMAPASESIAEEGNSGSQRATSLTPDGRSYLGVEAGMQSVNDSFVSIASSADLTSDKRASQFTSRISRGNTSFPNILLPGNISQNSPGGSLRGVADSRVDGVKIHKHLNAMNKQLLESNADLAREAEAWRDEVDRMKGLLRDAGIEVEEVDVLAQLGERSQASEGHSLSARQARYSTPGDDSLGPLRLERSISAPIEGEMDHTAILQEMADKLEGLEDDLAEKDNIISELQQRLDQDSSMNRDANAQGKIDELHDQLDEAERERADLHTDFAQKTEQHAKRFGEICTGFEEQVKSLEGQLKFAQAEVERLRADKSKMDGLSSSVDFDERDRERARRIEELERELGQVRDDLEARSAEVDMLRKHSEQVQAERDDLIRDVETLQDQVKELESAEPRADLDQDLEAVRADLAHVEEELAKAHADLDELRQIDSDKEAELDEQHEQIELLSNRLQELEGQNLDSEQDGQEIQRLHDVIEEINEALTAKESELEAMRAKADMDSLRQSTSSAHAPPQAANESFVAAMEDRLEEAHREIGKLKHELASTPHRKSHIEMQDARIKALEREKAALAERLSAKEQSGMQSGSMLAAGSPFKVSPFVNKALASLKTPKTPGPLGELSWLQSSIGDSHEPVLRAQLEFLQDELKNANDQLDNNFSRLESAGFGALSLAEKLAKANERISDLEDELRGLSQRNKASIALVTAQRDEDNRDHEDKLEDALAEMNQQMDDLKADLAAEKSRLQRDNGRLQNLVSEINLKRTAEVDSFKSELARLEVETEEEIQAAKDQVISMKQDLELAMQDKSTTSGRIRQLERDLAAQMDAYDDLSARLNGQAQNDDFREQLETQSKLVKTLQSALRDANMSTDRLRLTLKEKTDSLRHAETTVSSLQRERASITKELLEFEADLQKQRVESEGFGRELRVLKLEQGGSARLKEDMAVLQRNYRSAKEGLQVAKDQLAIAVQRAGELEKWQSAHLHDNTHTSEALAEQKFKFKAQTRDLAAQIRYLKAKFTRESTFRNGLALQKRYLLLMIGGMSLNEHATLKAIASMGHPVPEIKRPKRTLKSVGLAVVSIIRARNVAKKWREEVMLKSDAVLNHQERRRVSLRG